MKYRITNFDQERCSITVLFDNNVSMNLDLQVNDDGSLPSNQRIKELIMLAAPTREEIIRVKANAMAPHLDRVASLVDTEEEMTLEDISDLRARQSTAKRIANIDAAIAEMEVIPSVTI